MSNLKKQEIRIRYTPHSVEKLENTYGYIADYLHNPPAAKKAIKTIGDTLARLTTFPEMGALVSSVYDEVPQDFIDARFIVCGSYIAIYDYSDGVVSVLDVFHTREDIQGQLFGMTSPDND
ncbi:MAG: type II toxin-antitoxin system RelE/ParE family toxin [Coriobacteriia bacterium]|nr:type II toxin-antitoxin system RelE/ParE family toxin [Coriobacteriia bacterium]